MVSDSLIPGDATSRELEGIGLIRALLYVVQFDKNLVARADRTLRTVVARHALGAPPAEYSEAIKSVLATGLDLMTVLEMPVEHTDTEIREYLAEIARRLETSGMA